MLSYLCPKRKANVYLNNRKTACLITTFIFFFLYLFTCYLIFLNSGIILVWFIFSALSNSSQENTLHIKMYKYSPHLPSTLLTTIYLKHMDHSSFNFFSPSIQTLMKNSLLNLHLNELNCHKRSMDMPYLEDNKISGDYD